MRYVAAKWCNQTCKTKISDVVLRLRSYDKTGLRTVKNDLGLVCCGLSLADPVLHGPFEAPVTNYELSMLSTV